MIKKENKNFRKMFIVTEYAALRRVMQYKAHKAAGILDAFRNILVECSVQNKMCTLPTSILTIMRQNEQKLSVTVLF